MSNVEAEKRKMICEIAGIDDIGQLSDGFHTFNSLYEQRMILFAALVKVYKDKAWKSYRHEDGEYCFGGGWFIVGIDTPKGSYTYHYENKYFDLFDCEELACGKHWDGHTEKDVTRLLTLPSAQPESEDAVSRQAVHNMLENIPIGPNEKWFNWLQKACLRLAELPSVTPQSCKDAVNKIKNASFTGNDGLDYVETLQALDALKLVNNSFMQSALCGDAVSRQAVIDELKRISFSHYFECGEYLSEDTRKIEIINSNKALEAIKALPSVQPERKKARWIPHKSIFGGLGEKVYTCNQCEYNIGFHTENFCPNCGARMEEGGE